MKRDLVGFDLNLLVAFDTLMTERGVTRAGRILGITQAAMSNTLRRLRGIFGDPLFFKSANRMEPTPLALELAGPVEEALREIRLLLDQENFDPATARSTFRIGMVDYAASLLLPPLLERLEKIAPGVTIELIDVGGEDEHSVLEDGTADLVFGRFQEILPKLLLHRVFEMEYVCVFRKNHPLVADKLTLDAFLAAQHIHYYPRGMTTTVVDEALSQQGLERNIVARLFSLSLVPFILQDTDKMAIMPGRVARYIAKPLNLQVAAIPIDSPKLRLAVAWHPRVEKSPANIWLRDLVLEILQDSNNAGETGVAEYTTR